MRLCYTLLIISHRHRVKPRVKRSTKIFLHSWLFRHFTTLHRCRHKWGDRPLTRDCFRSTVKYWKKKKQISSWHIHAPSIVAVTHFRKSRSTFAKGFIFDVRREKNILAVCEWQDWRLLWCRENPSSHPPQTDVKSNNFHRVLLFHTPPGHRHRLYIHQ